MTWHTRSENHLLEPENDIENERESEKGDIPRESKGDIGDIPMLILAK